MKLVKCSFCGTKNDTEEKIIFVRAKRACICTECIKLCIDSLVKGLSKEKDNDKMS